MRAPWVRSTVVLLLGIALGIAGGKVGTSGTGGSRLSEVASVRGLTGDEAEAALRSFVPPGKSDEYVLIASGGHSGQIHILGVPSMRLLKTVPVFTAESWSGYGFGGDSGDKILAGGTDPREANQLRWGDSHHPAISETNGEYDGRFVYINDRANGRIGMVDLFDFKAKQIIDVPNMQTSHGGVFVTPNTEYAHISSMTPVPFTANHYAPLEQYQDKYRGVSSFMAIDKDTGRMQLDESFQIELPPYTQDLADAGKLASDGFAFINSYNTEMATGGNMEGKDPLETSATARDYDYLHIINWKKAAQVAKTVGSRNGIRFIPLKTAISEGVLYFAPEPRNPHGIDVSPDGNYLTVAGKLDPTTNIYTIERIKEAIAKEDFEGTDPFGVPILRLDAVREAQVEVGAGPLHTQYDGKGFAYTSLFVESAIAKWSLGPEAGVAEADAWKLVDKIPVHYNIGHVVTAEGDTVSPDGNYMVALNKWSVDRFPVVGTLHPQNFQLVDISGEKMKLLADMPIGFGEPHYVQMMKIDKLQRVQAVYPPGTDPLTLKKSPDATKAGEERTVRKGDRVEVFMTAMRSHYTPDIIRVRRGDRVTLHITNIETARDATHGFAIPGYDKQVSLDPGEVVTLSFLANRTGSFAYYCTEFCSALHLEMQGWLLVEP